MCTTVKPTTSSKTLEKTCLLLQRLQQKAASLGKRTPGDKGGGGWHMNRGKPSSWVNAYRSEYCVKRRFEAPSGASMGMVNTGKGVAAVVVGGHAPGYEGEYLLG